MEHSTCLEKLALLGASLGSLALVRAFLEERLMTISIDGHTPDPIPIQRGKPTGQCAGLPTLLCHHTAPSSEPEG